MKKWLPTLEKKLEAYSEGSHENYRVYISAEPAGTPESHIIPQGILESSIKITNEPPTGMQANLHQALDNFNQVSTAFWIVIVICNTCLADSKISGRNFNLFMEEVAFVLCEKVFEIPFGYIFRTHSRCAPEKMNSRAFCSLCAISTHAWLSAVSLDLRDGIDLTHSTLATLQSVSMYFTIILKLMPRWVKPIDW